MGEADSPAVSFRSEGDVAIHVPDLERAREFYGGVLGFRKILDEGDKLAFATGAFTLWVNLDDRVMSYIPSFTVPDYDAARERLARNGCRILKEHPQERSLYFADPFGLVGDIIEKR